jgi:hypothetical protein
MANPKVKKTKPSHQQQEDEDLEDKGGMFLDKEDIQLLLKALSAYKPTEDEEYLHSGLLKRLEMIRYIDFAEITFGG